MGAKRIRISVDDGSTWYTFPGSTGEKRTEMASVNDTIFGQEWSSEQPSIGQVQITCNGFFKGVGGYQASVKKSGTSTAMTAEACTLVSGKTYQINNTAKRVIDYNSALTVLDNAVDHTADVISIDYLNGLVTFDPAYTVTGPVTVTGNYMPLVALAKARGFSVTQTAAEIDTTDLATALANSGWRTFDPGLRTGNLEIQGVYEASSAFEAALIARSTLIMDISPNGSLDTFFRGYYKPTGHQQGGDVGALEAATFQMGLWVPSSNYLVAPFAWYFNSSPLPPAMKNALDAWQNGQKVKVQYLPDGVSGTEHDAIITECSLSDNFDSQNEFRMTFRGDGAPVAV